MDQFLNRELKITGCFYGLIFGDSEETEFGNDFIYKNFLLGYTPNSSQYSVISTC